MWRDVLSPALENHPLVLSTPYLCIEQLFLAICMIASPKFLRSKRVSNYPAFTSYCPNFIHKC